MQATDSGLKIRVKIRNVAAPAETPPPKVFQAVSTDRELPEPSIWLWLILPIAVFVLPYVTKAFAPAFYHRHMYGEFGIIENLTVLLLIAAIVYAIKAYRRSGAFPRAWFRFWVLLIGLGSFYYAGEEISWGQHFSGWTAPERWQEINDQQETNLHNTSAFFDQIPRNLLTVGALIGGFLVPVFIRRARRGWKPDRLKYWLWPTFVCIPVALFANIVHLPDKLPEPIASAVPELLDIREGESKEFFLAAFLMLYVTSITTRAKSVESHRNT